MPVDELQLTKPTDAVALGLNSGSSAARDPGEVGEEPRAVNLPSRFVYIAVWRELPFEALPRCMPLVNDTKATKDGRHPPQVHVNGWHSRGREKGLHSCCICTNCE